MSSFDEDSSYVIKRGYLLIINNVHFKLRAGPRNGTIAEGEAVQAMFKSFGFDVRTEYNLTARDIKEILRQTASNPDMGKYLMSFGFFSTVLHSFSIRSAEMLYIEYIITGKKYMIKCLLLFFHHR